eukprot:CAMPEP_0118934462 /NCGR_PEP_ID=MMETSP1169-20130426/13837_1 /TAXON_ID=36882 /ORGANISM="Pyramimonas obovata, Strain CCMP722" /LENGTH=51 /DNA_ID=CAMNT_0006877367 /DNA_START=326 /DNA_END=481 /DNA_ORIENTATION=-
MRPLVARLAVHEEDVAGLEQHLHLVRAVHVHEGHHARGVQGHAEDAVLKAQ